MSNSHDELHVGHYAGEMTILLYYVCYVTFAKHRAHLMLSSNIDY